MKIFIVEYVKTFPVPFELGKMLNKVVVIGCTLAEQVLLNGNCYLVVLGLMDGLKTLPDFTSCVEPTDMHHLILGDVIGDQNLHVDIILVPRSDRVWTT